MPYNPAYLMQQMARGRPLPTGSPEHELTSAIDRLSPMDIDAAIQHGARPPRDVFHRLFDRCLSPSHSLTIPMDRLMACCRALSRAGAAWDSLDARTGVTALRRAADLADHPQALSWYLFLRGQRRYRWDQPESRDRQTLLEVWHAKASASMRAHLPPLPAAPEEPKASRPRLR